MTATKKKAKSVLSAKVVEKIEKELLERKKQILDDLKSISSKDEHDKDEHKAKFPEYGDKADENAQEISQYSTNLATEKILESTLRDINNSLKRIREDTHGVCKYCQKEIGEKRMLARPVASACIDCKTKLQNS